MNTLIVPTDFSPNADHALQYAAQLAQYIHASIRLVNIYIVPVTMNDMPPVMLVSAEELKKSADEGLERCRQELQKQYPDVVVTTESRLGDIYYELETVCKEVQPFALVMSTHKTGSFENFLFGNTTLSAARHLHQPIIIVSPDAAFAPPQTIALATDLVNIGKMPAEKIKAFAQTLNAQFHVVHVVANDNKQTESDIKALEEKISPLPFNYQVINDDEVTHGLEQYVQEHHIDLLLLIPHEHSFIGQLFANLHTKDIVQHMSIPVTCISE